MITRAKADEAWTILRSHYMGEDDLSMEFPTEAATVNAVYRRAAARTHPDKEGGSTEAFARVDWAKHALLEWLKKPHVERPAIKFVPCANCDGKGWFKIQRGLRLGVRQHCVRCNGTGDAGYDPDKYEGGNMQ